MGSHNFEHIIYNNAPIEDVYRDLVAAALHESGHGGYNGTISTTSGVHALPNPAMTIAQARTIAAQRLDHLAKWEPCEAIRLVHETQAEWEDLGKQTIELTMPGPTFNDYTLVRALIAKALKVKVEQVARFTVAYTPDFQRKVTFTTKVTATAPKAKTETRYFIINPDLNALPKWEQGHQSQAEARAALSDALTPQHAPAMNFGLPSKDLEIVSMTRRVTGEPLVAATVAAKTVTVTYEVHLRKQTKAPTTGTTHAGWLVYGWAAS